MAYSYWPFENVDTNETQFSQWARNIGEGVKVSSGSDLLVYGDSTGMQVKLPAGQSMIRGHYFANDALATIAITTANATNPRIDAVVLELDPTANTILPKVVAGTAAASPVAPTLTQTDAGIYQQVLAYVAVAAAASTITAANVTDARSFVASVNNRRLTGQTLEQALLVGTGFAGYTFSARSGLVQIITANSTANGTVNFRADGSTTLSASMNVGDSVTCVLEVTNGATAYYPTAWQIDGTAVTPKWVGTAPAAGSASAVDVYTINITKLSATPTYQVLASATKFA
jgi:hypothetical protein